jgi:hypothetical protein
MHPIPNLAKFPTTHILYHILSHPIHSPAFYHFINSIQFNSISHSKTIKERTKKKKRIKVLHLSPPNLSPPTPFPQPKIHNNYTYNYQI